MSLSWSESSRWKRFHRQLFMNKKRIEPEGHLELKIDIIKTVYPAL